MEIGDVDGVIKKAGLCKRTFEIQEHRRDTICDPSPTYPL